MQKGCIQLYYGDGKGKTTAAMGQIVRCVGHGFKVLVYQFLKEPNSGEVSVIRSLPGVDYIENEGPIPFMFNLTPEQQEFYKEKFQKKFDDVREKYFSGNDTMELSSIYEELCHMEKERLDSLKDSVSSAYDKAGEAFDQLPDGEDRDILQKFAFICNLSFDVYLKKMMIERIIDDIAAPSSKNKKD